MNKMWQKIMMFVLSIVLGVIIMSQIKTTNNILGNVDPADKTNELREELNKLTVEKSRLKEELEELKEKNKDNEEIYKAVEDELQRLKIELEKQQIISGYFNVKGPGMTIKIDAEPDSYVSLASNHQYILALISYLNNAGVEAISINGQRYTNFTEIVPVLNHVNINGVAMVLPLEIKAIGNPRTIEASLNFVGGIVAQLNNIGYTVEYEESKEIFINRYDGHKELRYVVPIDKEDI